MTAAQATDPAIYRFHEILQVYGPAIRRESLRSPQVLATALAIVTLLAVPPALLLAFFALSGRVQDSLRNVSAPAALYAVEWGPFIALIAGAWIAGRFFKARPQPGTGEAETPGVRPPS